MRRRVRECCLVVVFVLGGAVPASADMMEFWRWWDSLSGPGPWNGVMVDTRLFTHGYKLGEQGDAPRLFFDPRGVNTDESRGRPIRFGVQWGVLKAEKNKLPYVDRPAPGVWAIPISGTVDVRAIPGVDVGATLGVIRFTGDGFGFWRTTLSPRVIIAPGALGREAASDRQRAIQIVVTATGILGSFDAADFGAIGDFKGGNEVLWGTSIGVNLLALK